MPTGSFDLDPPPVQLTTNATSAIVCRYDDETEDEDKRYTVIPNVRCVSVQIREGASPSTARFAYILDDAAVANGWPTQFEQILRLSQRTEEKSEKPEKYARFIVKSDDRIVVFAYPPSGQRKIMFDGFAQGPQANLDSAHQEVTFQASSVAIRLWDEPIHKILQRDVGTDLVSTAENRHLLPLRCRVNPKGIGNRIPSTGQMESHDSPGEAFPIFLDWLKVSAVAATNVDMKWDLAQFARYLMGSKNHEQEYVENPDFTDLDAVLECRKPKEGSDTFDPSDSSTYDSTKIILPEMDFTGRSWPDALSDLLTHYGFGMRFSIELDPENDHKPRTWIEVYRRDGAGPFEAKTIPYGEASGDLDPSKWLPDSVSIVRDYQSAFNAVVVDTEPELWEISVVLMPAFAPSILDASTPLNWNLSNLTNAAAVDRNKYRLFIAAECIGDEYFFQGGGAWSNNYVGEEEFTLFDSIWPKDESGNRTYISRCRPGRYTLSSRDQTGKPRRSTLQISTDYDGPQKPHLWSSGGTWQTVSQGWELCKDRLGIYVSVENPERWAIGDHPSATQAKGTILRLITQLGNASTANLSFRLTTVIEGDARVIPQTYRRESSSLKFDRWHIVNARDDFKSEFVHESSIYFGDTDPDARERSGPDVEASKVARLRDDRDAAEAYAAQIQSAHENPPIAGTVTIPCVAFGYGLADQISRVSGRDLSLVQNAATEAGDAPRYPYVVGIDWTFSPHQSTTMHLSDRRAEPRPIGVGRVTR